MRLAAAIGLVPLLLLLGGSGPASADEASLFSPEPHTAEQILQPPLHFTKFEVGRRNVLYVWGGIDAGDSERFRTAMEAAKPIEEIWFFSPGGVLSEGLEIGRIIRKHKFATRIRGNAECTSACNFMFMGGTIRTIEPGGTFGVHMFANENYKAIKEHVDAVLQEVKKYNDEHPDAKKDPDAKVAEVLDKDVRIVQETSAQIASEIARFLAEMELSLRFLTAFASIPNETPRALSRDELRDFNIVNTD